MTKLSGLPPERRKPVLSRQQSTHLEPIRMFVDALGDGRFKAVSVEADTNELTNAYIKLFLVVRCSICKVIWVNEKRRFLISIVNV